MHAKSVVKGRPFCGCATVCYRSDRFESIFLHYYWSVLLGSCWVWKFDIPSILISAHYMRDLEGAPHPGSMVHDQKVKGSDRSYLYGMWSSIRFMSSVRIMHDQRARECLLHVVYGRHAKGKQKSTNHTAHSTMLVGQLVVECLSSHANKY